MLLYILIAVAAIVIIAVVAIVVVISGKKKAAPARPGATIAQPQPPFNGANPNRPPVSPAGSGFAPSAPQPPRPGNSNTVAINQGAGETTVLSGAGETTVLSQQVHGGSLFRKKNGESISINRAEFTIGRERNSVTYCISDNSSIGRTHVKLFVRNGTTYLVDQNSKNGSFINGVKAAPNQEMPLKAGDKVTLADEDFEFRA